MALVGIGWYTPYHGKCTTPDGSLVTGDPVPSLGACRALPAVWSMSEDAPGCSDGVSSNATECREAFRAPPSGWTNGLNWETPLWCDIVVFIFPVPLEAREAQHGLQRRGGIGRGDGPVETNAKARGARVASVVERRCELRRRGQSATVVGLESARVVCKPRLSCCQRCLMVLRRHRLGGQWQRGGTPSRRAYVPQYCNRSAARRMSSSSSSHTYAYDAPAGATLADYSRSRDLREQMDEDDEKSHSPDSREFQ